MAVHVFDNGVHYIIEPKPRPRKRVQRPAPPRTQEHSSTPSFKKEPDMSKDSTASAGAEQTSTKQEAPGGTKGEFAATWTLRRVVKIFLDLLGKTVVTLAWCLLLIAIQPATTIAFIACLVPFVAGMFVESFYFEPHTPKIADYVVGKGTAALTKVKGWFKKSETTTAAAAA